MKSNKQPLNIDSSFGRLKVCRDSGIVMSHKVDREEFLNNYIKYIIWFDLDTYYEARPELDRETDRGIDICHLNFWSLIDGEPVYELAADSWLENLRDAQEN